VEELPDSEEKKEEKAKVAKQLSVRHQELEELEEELLTKEMEKENFLSKQEDIAVSIKKLETKLAQAKKTRG